eukprot:TRINITY_DN22955_c0_g1_i2.p1 TRINITY_DN22955_c0_g1~~TRINITY_DN22955_c0_g1_i2.p1  ORF type:complete len:458 (-),score=143.22 TRINITY_DN22955_c0_g1_i2:28-1401(-)
MSSLQAFTMAATPPQIHQHLQAATSLGSLRGVGAAAVSQPAGFEQAEVQEGAASSSSSSGAFGFAGAAAAAVCGAGVLARAAERRRANKRSSRLASVSQRRAVTFDETSVEEERRPVFPFAGIVGQQEMKLALILNVIDPRIGGVMCLGDRGTGKTTTIRALVDLLPEIDCVAQDPYNSSPKDFDVMSDEVREKIATRQDITVVKRKVPMVDLPLGATEDRVCGTIDIEKALTEGVKSFEPGLLARANRGILYVDEVNLLDDHLVDVLLDSAAGGWNTVEREGISIRHPAKFILVGSGNPEEGELRPQLLDRFGMYARIATEREPELRVKIVAGCQKFADDPENFRSEYNEEHGALSEKIVAAQKRLEDVVSPPELKTKISMVCQLLGVDGLRGDIVTNRAARAYAAFEGRAEVTEEDILKVISLCLRHRLKKDALETMDSGEAVEKACAEVFELDE